MATEAQCGSCGESNPSDSAFCLMCGTYLGWHEQGPPLAARPPAPATQPPATQPPTPATQPPTPATQPPAPVAQPAQPATPARPLCPACGHPLEPGRRFCGRCGHAVVAAPRPVAPRAGGTPDPGRSGGGAWGGDPRERAARRAYRRSLPPLYRWRRVLGGLLALVAVGAVAWFVAGDPVGRVHGAWADLTDATEPLEVLSAEAVPVGSAVPGRAPGNLLDGDPDTAWVTPWRADRPRGAGCASPGGGVRLSWEGAAEVRRLRVRAGLAEGNLRDRQPLPTELGIGYGDRCASVELDSSAGWQTVEVELAEPVDSVVLRVLEAAENRTEPRIPRVALRDVELLVRPR